VLTFRGSMPSYCEDRAGYLPGRVPRLHYRVWLPRDRRPRAAVVLVHGLGDHSGRWRQTALRLAAEGMQTYALDLRGFGLSEGRRGHVDRFEAFTADLAAFVRWVADDMRLAAPLFLLGHSLGGLVVLDLVLSGGPTVQGVALSSPCLRIRFRVPRWRRALALHAGRRLPWLALPSGIPPAFRTQNPEAVLEFLRDPLTHDLVSAGLYREWLAAMERVRERADRLRVPCLFLQAGGDLLVDPVAVAEFYERAGATHKVFVLYTDWYHEVFSEPGRERAHDDLLRWLRTCLAG